MKVTETSSLVRWRKQPMLSGRAFSLDLDKFRSTRLQSCVMLSTFVRLPLRCSLDSLRRLQMHYTTLCSTVLVSARLLGSACADTQPELAVTVVSPLRKASKSTATG